jgi:UDP-N-acetyl-D-galactosamine dehydrogenase
VIHSGRLVNNGMGKFIAEKVVKTLIQQHKNISNTRVLILGCSFKENIGDTRNSKVFDIVKELMDYSVSVDIVDPIVNNPSFIPVGMKVMNEMNISQKYDAVVLAVKHDAFVAYDLKNLKNSSIHFELNLFDVKGFYERDEALRECKVYWRL